jgi:hypothetical protein
MSGRPLRAGWRRATFWAITLVLLGLWGSGTLLWALPLQDAVEPELGLARSAVVLHGVLAWPCCVLLGRGVWPHLGLVWRRRPGQSAAVWAFGVLLLALLVLWLLSGLVLLYGPSAWHEALSPWHSRSGLVWPLVYLAHVGVRARARTPWPESRFRGRA